MATTMEMIEIPSTNHKNHKNEMTLIPCQRSSDIMIKQKKGFREKLYASLAFISLNRQIQSLIFIMFAVRIG